MYRPRPHHSSQLIKLECWKQQQKLIPTTETQQKIAAQNDMLRLHINNTEVRRMPKPSSESKPSEGRRAGAGVHNRHRKLSMTRKKGEGGEEGEGISKQL